MVSKRADEVKLVVFVCEAGMGSSLIGANQLKKKIKDAGLDVRVVHSPVNEIPSNTDVVVSHESLADRARKVAPNAVVKCPLTKDGLKAVKYLSSKGIRVNQTLCFSATQALLSAKAGAFYISPFLGRLDDIAHVGMDLIRDICEIYRVQGYRTQVLAASIRNPLHVVDAAKAGAHVATMPFNVLEQLMKHPLTDIGLKKFLDDWAKLGEKI